MTSFKPELISVPSSLTFSLSRSHDSDWTTPYMIGFERVFIKNPRGSMNYWAYLQPLSFQIWLLFLLGLFGLPIITFVLWHKAEEPETIQIEQAVSAVGFAALNMGTELNPRRASSRILVLSFVFAAFLLMKHWEAILISFLATQSVNLPFLNIEDLFKNTDMRLVIIPGGMIENDFRYSTSPLWQAVFKERIEPHLEEIASYEDHAIDLHYFIRNDYKTALYDVYEAYR